MKGIILASHGRLAEGMLDTLQIFSGDIKQIKSLCLLPGDDVSAFLDKMQDAIKEVDEGDGVVIFCDLLFGSPCNCSARILNECSQQNAICVITGMNLSMVLEFIGARETGMDIETIVQTGQQGIVDFGKMMEERKS